MDSSQIGIGMSASLVLSCTGKEVKESLGPLKMQIGLSSRESFRMLWDETGKLYDEPLDRTMKGKGGGKGTSHFLLLLSSLCRFFYCL